MKLQSIRIENYRSFNDETVPINNYSCLVGPNGAGKSTVLSALNIFFQNTTSATPNVRLLEVEDFHNRNLADPIRITLTFSDLNSNAKAALGDYVRQDKLIVSAEATWDEKTQAAPIKQHGQRLGIKAFADSYFSKVSAGAKVTELKPIFTQLRSEYPDIPAATTGAAMAEALRSYEAEHPTDCEPIQSSDEFYGANSGKLNNFVHWVYVPAVKDAQEEGEESKKSALGQLLARTVRAKTDFGTKIEELRNETFSKFQSLVDENQDVLAEVSDKLRIRLAEWSHSDTNLDLKWMADPSKSVQVIEPMAGVSTGEGDFTGSLSRMGHGLQRSYLLALLTELASLETDNAPTLILACEEPELYQHPPQARRLADVFLSLAEANTQVIVTTHSPYFVTGKDFEAVRLIRRSTTDKCSISKQTSNVDLKAYLDGHSHHKERPNPAGMRAKISQSLQPHLNEMFFCRHPVFVEGLEDVAFITAALHLYGYWDRFHSLGCHLVPANGKNHLIHPVAIARCMEIPFFLVFDCDGDAKEPDLPKHEPDNKTLFSLVDMDVEDAFPENRQLNDRCAAWPKNMGAMVEADFDSAALLQYHEAARRECGQAKSLNKNSMFIAEWLALAFEAGKRSSTLEELCNAIIKSAT